MEKRLVFFEKNGFEEVQVSITIVSVDLKYFQPEAHYCLKCGETLQGGICLTCGEKFNPDFYLYPSPLKGKDKSQAIKHLKEKNYDFDWMRS